MARAFRFGGSQVFIRIDAQLPLAPRHTMSLVIGTTGYALPLSRYAGSLVELRNYTFALEQILIEVGDAIPKIMITDSEDDDVRIIEDLYFHPSIFAPFFDFARNEEIPPFAQGAYRRPELLAVFTHVHNDRDGLAIWERHYGRLVPHRHLYVIDHGSDCSPSDMLHRDTQVVSIPRGQIDHINISQFCSHFQRFLLDQFQWVLHVDCDELLVDRGNFDGLLSKLLREDYGPIIRPMHALELLDHTEGMSGIDPTLPLSLQRHLTTPAPGYHKPVLARTPTTWSLGFHDAFESSHIKEDPDLWLLHVRYADLAIATRREGTWTDGEQSEAALLFTPQQNRSNTLDGLREKIARELTSDRSTVPEWMIGFF